MSAKGGVRDQVADSSVYTITTRYVHHLYSLCSISLSYVVHREQRQLHKQLKEMEVELKRKVQLCSGWLYHDMNYWG